MNKEYNEKIIANERIAENIYLLTATCGGGLLSEFIPGQFSHIKIPNSSDLLLRRPISLHGIDYEKKTVSFIYAVVGVGTRRLSMQKPGSELNLLAPLGNGFSIKSKDKDIVLIGGGIGCAPLKSVTDKYPDKNYKLFFGFKSKSQNYIKNSLTKIGEVFLTTEDGTDGEKGFITDLLREYLKDNKPDLILSCGPEPFYKSLKEIIAKTDIETQASLEQRMGCGTGGCAVCVCSVNGKYRKACCDGPVFDLREVDFND